MKALFTSLLMLLTCLNISAATQETTPNVTASDSIVLVFSDTTYTVSADSIFLTPSDSIISHGNYYTYHGKTAYGFDIVRLLKNEGAAHRVMICSRICYWTGAPFAFVGGGLLAAWPITAVATWSPQWMLGALGAGAIVVSIPFFIAADKLTAKAVNMHNENIQKK